MQERFGIIGTSPGVRQVLDRVRQVASTQITVLVQGESGTGKELFAQAIHHLSPRRHKKMLVVNCGAIPEGLIESELFGAEKGAYTGAVERRTGYFEEADGSTIFLDEIGEMPLTAQVRLLRVLETGQFSRVGSSSTIKSDVRVIAATNKDLGDEVQNGRFREDLYYRLTTVIIRVPPLRERKEDIIPIFDHFQHQFSQRYNSTAPALTRDAHDLLTHYRWPGNIRELRNLAEQTVVLMQGGPIGADVLRPYLRGVSSGGSGMGLIPVQSASGADTSSDVSGARERELIYRVLLELRVEVREMNEQLQAFMRSGNRFAPEPDREEPTGDRARYLLPPKPDADPVDHYEDVPYELDQGEDGQDPSNRSNGQEAYAEEFPTLEDAERRLILAALERFEGNRRQTAEALGISERTLYRKLKDYEELK